MSDKTVTIIKNNPFVSFLWMVFNLATAIIGYNIHHSIFWSILDFLFSPFAWAKWLICHEVNLTLIKQAFSFFLS